jgi:hypothetical protein
VDIIWLSSPEPFAARPADRTWITDRFTRRIQPATNGYIRSDPLVQDRAFSRRTLLHQASRERRANDNRKLPSVQLTKSLVGRKCIILSIRFTIFELPLSYIERDRRRAASSAGQQEQDQDGNFPEVE